MTTDALDDTRSRIARTDIPHLSLWFGFGAMIPFPLGAFAAWIIGGTSGLASALTILWGGIILIFLAGVRRGLSFVAPPHGPTSSQISVMAWLFGVGMVALITPWPVIGYLALFVGFLSLLLLDPMAARRGEVPEFIARLRVVQMTIPVVSFAALLILAWR